MLVADNERVSFEELPKEYRELCRQKKNEPLIEIMFQIPITKSSFYEHFGKTGKRRGDNSLHQQSRRPVTKTRAKAIV